jgi:hypothetical protein
MQKLRYSNQNAAYERIDISFKLILQKQVFVEMADGLQLAVNTDTIIDGV